MNGAIVAFFCNAMWYWSIVADEYLFREDLVEEIKDDKIILKM